MLRHAGLRHHVGVGRERHDAAADEPRRLGLARGRTCPRRAGRARSGRRRRCARRAARSPCARGRATATPLRHRASLSSCAMSAVILSSAALPTPYTTLCAYCTAPDDDTFTIRPRRWGEHERDREARRVVVRAHADVDDLVPRPDGHLPERLAEPRREVGRAVHVVHEHVEAPVLVADACRTTPRPARRRGGRTRPRSPVPPSSSISAAVSPMVPGSTPGLDGARGDVDGRARGAELEGDALADAPARARHHGDLPGQSTTHEVRSLRTGTCDCAGRDEACASRPRLTS